MASSRNADAAFFILLSLSSGPLHGYAIRKTVEELSHGRTRLGTGTLYGAIKRFLDLGWITPVPRAGAPSKETTRTRREYALAAAGRKELAREVERITSLREAAVRTGVLKPSRA